jgi:hypothetical protein
MVAVVSAAGLSGRVSADGAAGPAATIPAHITAARSDASEILGLDKESSLFGAKARSVAASTNFWSLCLFGTHSD